MGSVEHTHWYKRWTSFGLAWLAWSIMYGVLQRASSQFGFEYNINVAVLWRLFGPGDIYSFRNLALPRFINFIATSVPAALTGLLVYKISQSSQRRFTMAGIAIIVGSSIGFAAFGEFAVSNSTTELPTVGLSLLFLLFLVFVTVLAGYFLEKGNQV